MSVGYGIAMVLLPPFHRDQLETLDKESLITLILSMQEQMLSMHEQMAKMAADFSRCGINSPRTAVTAGSLPAATDTRSRNPRACVPKANGRVADSRTMLDIRWKGSPTRITSCCILRSRVRSVGPI